MLLAFQAVPVQIRNLNKELYLMPCIKYKSKLLNLFFHHYLSEEALQQGEAEYQRNDSSEEQENRDDEASNGHAFLRTADADD